jgi:hypothetical protein
MQATLAVSLCCQTALLDGARAGTVCRAGHLVHMRVAQDILHTPGCAPWGVGCTLLRVLARHNHSLVLSPCNTARRIGAPAPSTRFPAGLRAASCATITSFPYLAHAMQVLGLLPHLRAKVLLPFIPFLHPSAVTQCSLSNYPSSAQGWGTCASRITSGYDCAFTCKTGYNQIIGNCRNAVWTTEPSCQRATLYELVPHKTH